MPRYQSAVLTFIDVLGFGQLVERLTAEELARILTLFERHSAPFFLAESDQLSYVSFSDLIVRVSPLADPASIDELASRVATEASDIAAAQCLLAQKGIVVRGAIVHGDICIDGGRIFGPALVKAYTLESKAAVYPRVIFDQDLIDVVGVVGLLDDLLTDSGDFSIQVGELSQYCARDADGKTFVDYLGALCRLGNDGTAEELAEERLMLEKHRDLVLHGLRSTDPRIRTKYEWLRSYHNAIVDDDDRSLLVH